MQCTNVQMCILHCNTWQLIYQPGTEALPLEIIVLRQRIRGLNVNQQFGVHMQQMFYSRGPAGQFGGMPYGTFLSSLAICRRSKMKTSNLCQLVAPRPASSCFPQFHNSLFFWCNFENHIFGTSQVFGTKSWIFLSFGGFRNCDVTVKGEYEHARDQIFNRLTSCFQLFGFPLKTFENFNNLFEPWWICTSSFGFYILYIWGQRSVTLTTKNHSFSHFSHWPDFCETSCPCNGF